MTTSKGPEHVVVDGSNIATEGRSLPSLEQLHEAVMSFMDEHPDTTITVVVDATFGHRIEKKEVKEFEEGISNNELVAPPAGAIGRGDAFVLSIAQKAHASILSNDSFQEFHADYEWLFDEGRLIGGKPVPHVGWVFVNRSPVRGPVSRKVTQGSKSKSSSRRGSKQTSGGSSRGDRSANRSANEPMPVPTSPPPGPPTRSEEPEPAARKASPRGGDPVNELLPFLEFVEHHPVGTSINGTVESYSSHGAYIAIGDQGVRGYVPLRLMASPAPTSARKVMRLGESVTLVVVSFAAARRSIDCAVPDMAEAAIADAQDEADDRREDSQIDEPATKKAPAKKAVANKPAVKKDSAKKTSAKRAAAKKTPAKKAPAKRATAKKAAAKKAPARKAPARKAPAKKTVAGEAPAKKAPTGKAAVKKAPSGKAAAGKAAAKKAPTGKAPAKKTAAKKASAKKTTAKNSAVKKAPAKKAPAKKAPAKKTAAKKAPVKRAAAKKTAAKKAPVKKAAAKNAAMASKPASAASGPSGAS